MGISREGWVDKCIWWLWNKWTATTIYCGKRRQFKKMEIFLKKLLTDGFHGGILI
jgi:hypothetical protein